MSRRWVVNASPLILLGKIDQIELLGELADELILPKAVVQEIGAKGEGESLLRKLASLPAFQLAESIVLANEVEVWDLGQEESEVLTHAVRLEGCRAVVDDREARRCAQALGVRVIGTLGVVLRARRRRLIPAAQPMVARLREAGLYVSDELVEKALAHLGEG